MSKIRLRILIGVSLGVLAAVLCTSVLRAEPPDELILESYSSPSGPVFWEGPAILWVDGVKFSGTVTYSGEGKMNEDSWHGTEVKVYDFPGLGLLEVTGRAKTAFAYVSPEHRWHRYSSHDRITYGEGAFEHAHGTLQFVGYTDWDLTGARPPLAFEGTRARIRGMQLPSP